jgi:septal ring factor EnvC (AmiA/AmiB activator)
MAPAVSLLLLAAAAPDTFSREELEALESEKRVAEQKLAALQASGEDARKDLDNVDADLIAAAMETRRREEQAAEAEKSLADLGTRRITAQMRLLEDQQALEDLLAALAASNRRKPPALVISPGKANTAVRRAILMSETTPRLAARTETVRAEIDELNALERRIRGEKARLEAAEATLALKQVEIERLAAAKRGAFEDLSGDIARLRVPHGGARRAGGYAARPAARARIRRANGAGRETGAPAAPGGCLAQLP